MQQLDRIKDNEEALNKSIKAIEEFKEALDKYKVAQEEIKKVFKYLGSKEWFRDYDDVQYGKVDIKAGILSEDAAYDMLEENKELAIEMLEAATSILKND